MHRTRTKVCGVTNAHDAELAVDAGADAVGAVFAPSPRQVTVEQATELFAEVPPPVARVGVFVDSSASEIAHAVSECGLSAVQLNGQELPGLCDSIGVPVLKAMHIGTDFDSSSIEPYRGHVAALLLDTYVADKAGGTSQVFDWQSLGALPGWARIIVAGGLNPDNVASCISVLHPYGVDVSSGVEASPGIKSPERLAAFVEAVRRVDEEVGQ